MKTLLKVFCALVAVLIIGMLFAACKESAPIPFTSTGHQSLSVPKVDASGILPGGSKPTMLKNAATAQSAETPATPDVKPATPADTKPPKVTKHATIKTVKGDMEVELYGEDAPKTVANFVALAGKHFYKGLTFHRVESSPDFRLIQGGDPKGDGSGGSGKTIPLEISPKLRHDKGALAMARSQDRDSASCQFYICINAIHQLDDNYAVFGKVTKGLEVADKIVKGDQIKDIIIH